MAFVELGPITGPTLLCCHGMGLDHKDLIELVMPFADVWHIVLWDMPGHGASGPLRPECSLETLTDELEALIAHLSLVDPVLLGFSFGGMIAQELIRRRTHKVRGLIAIGCFAPFLVDPPLTPDLAEQMLVTPILSLPWNQMRAIFAAACSASPQVQAALVPAIDRLGQDGLAAMTRALIAGFRSDPFFRVDVPVLVIRGADDVNGEPLVASARALLAAAGEGREIVVDGGGHCVHLDQPGVVLSEIGKFLQRVW